uniref:Uncharacterized protein n=1 Tax=viral metagenome TaxID=1070528 RepID=A0A6M3XHJ9_9ZZZZ
MLITLENNHFIDIARDDITLWHGAKLIREITAEESMALIRERDLAMELREIELREIEEADNEYRRELMEED